MCGALNPKCLSDVNCPKIVINKKKNEKMNVCVCVCVCHVFYHLTCLLVTNICVVFQFYN